MMLAYKTAVAHFIVAQALVFIDYQEAIQLGYSEH